jgi:F-type H+-transporting ATPase subunit epsilon
MAMGPHVGSEAEVLEAHDLAGRTGAPLVVTVVMPKGTLATQDVDEVIAPGVEGEFGILPGHVPFLSSLRAGVLTIRKGQDKQIFAVGPGYLQVAGAKTTVLVEMAVAAGDVDEAAAQGEREQAEAQLRDAASHGAGAAGHAQANLEWAQAQLAAVAAAKAH